MVGIHPQNPAVQQAQTGKDSYRFLSSLSCHILFEGFGNGLFFLTFDSDELLDFFLLFGTLGESSHNVLAIQVEEFIAQRHSLR